MTAIANADEFLRFIVDDARLLFQQLDHIHLVAIHPDPPQGDSPQGRYFGDKINKALEWAGTVNSNGYNVYWTLNYVGPGVGTKPKKEQIQAARGAHCDKDPPKDGSPWDKGAVIAALTDHAVPPSLIIDSGNGVQPVWLFGSPEKDKASVETVNRGLEAVFGWLFRCEPGAKSNKPRWIVNPRVHALFADRGKEEAERRQSAKEALANALRS